MAYCTQADIEKLMPRQELAELTTESGDMPAAEVVTEGIVRAEAEIDSYLGVRYQLPLSTVPARVKSLAVDIAIYYLYSRRSAVPQVREQNYQNALHYLQEVAAGRALVLVGGAEVARVDSGSGQAVAAARVFSRERLREF